MTSADLGQAVARYWESAPPGGIPADARAAVVYAITVAAATDSRDAQLAQAATAAWRTAAHQAAAQGERWAYLLMRDTFEQAAATKPAPGVGLAADAAQRQIRRTTLGAPQPPHPPASAIGYALTQVDHHSSPAAQLARVAEATWPLGRRAGLAAGVETAAQIVKNDIETTHHGLVDDAVAPLRHRLGGPEATPSTTAASGIAARREPELFAELGVTIGETVPPAQIERASAALDTLWTELDRLGRDKGHWPGADVVAMVASMFDRLGYPEPGGDLTRDASNRAGQAFPTPNPAQRADAVGPEADVAQPVARPPGRTAGGGTGR